MWTSKASQNDTCQLSDGNIHLFVCTTHSIKVSNVYLVNGLSGTHPSHDYKGGISCAMLEKHWFFYRNVYILSIKWEGEGSTHIYLPGLKILTTKAIESSVFSSPSLQLSVIPVNQLVSTFLKFIWSSQSHKLSKKK